MCSSSTASSAINPSHVFPYQSADCFFFEPVLTRFFYLFFYACGQKSAGSRINLINGTHQKTDVAKVTTTVLLKVLPMQGFIFPGI